MWWESTMGDTYVTRPKPHSRSRCAPARPAGSPACAPNQKCCFINSFKTYLIPRSRSEQRLEDWEKEPVPQRGFQSYPQSLKRACFIVAQVLNMLRSWRLGVGKQEPSPLMSPQGFPNILLGWPKSSSRFLCKMGPKTWTSFWPTQYFWRMACIAQSTHFWIHCSKLCLWKTDLFLKPYWWHQSNPGNHTLENTTMSVYVVTQKVIFQPTYGFELIPKANFKK